MVATISNYAAFLSSTASSFNNGIIEPVATLFSMFATTSNQTDSDGANLNNNKYNFVAGNGNIRYDLLKQHFGHGTLFFRNNGANIVSTLIRPGNNDSLFTVGTSNFCMEYWVAPTSTGVLMSLWSESTSTSRRSWITRITSATTVTFEFRTASSSTFNTASCTNPSVNLYDGNFHHIVVQRRNNQIEIYIDGLLGSTPVAIAAGVGLYESAIWTYPTFGGYCYGSSYDSSDDVLGSFNGWLSELRMTTASRYAGTFTPPTTTFPKRAADDPLFASVKTVVTYLNPAFVTLSGTDVSKIDYTTGYSPADGDDVGSNGMFSSTGLSNLKPVSIKTTAGNYIEISNGEDCCIELVMYRLGLQAVMGEAGCFRVYTSGSTYYISLVVSGTTINFPYSIPETNVAMPITLIRKNGEWFRAKNGVWVDTVTPFATNNGNVILVSPVLTISVSGEDGSTQQPTGSDKFIGLRFTRSDTRYEPGVNFTPPDPSTFVTT